MINECKRSYKATGNGINTVQVTVDYTKGGINYFYGNTYPRGYYFNISGRMIEDHGWYVTESFTMGRGPKTFSDCILPCERQTKKRYETAKAMMDDLTDKYLAAWCERNGVTITDYDFAEEERERRA